MKRLLLLISIFALAAFGSEVSGQCSVTDASVTIKLQEAGTVANTCVTTFDLSFKLQFNGGNKIVVIQAWLADQYPNHWNCTQAHLEGAGNHGAPKAANLKKDGTGPLPFINLAFNNDVTPPQALSAYGPDNTVPIISGYTITRGPIDADGFQLITLQNVTATVPAACGTGVSIRADLWSSQGSINSGWQPHCVNCNNLYAFNYPEVSADISCTVPRRYITSVRNINTDQSITFTWKAYRDDFPYGGSRGAEDIVLVDDMNTPITLLPGADYNENRAYEGNATPPTMNHNLWVEVETEGLPNTQTALAPQASGCAPLPVKFQSFTAVRNKNNVSVKWETSTEVNNRGFYVQRNINGNWENVAFVFSKADNGNSNSVLSYNFTDLNTAKGVTQYRILQVDLDGKAKYSDIRSVRGEAMASKLLVYPNPTTSGSVNVVFDDQSPKNVTVLDMSGRTIKQYRNVLNNVTVENLENGIYSIQVTDVSTAAMSVEKVVVKKR